MKLATYGSLETETHGGKISGPWRRLGMVATFCLMAAPALLNPVEPARGAEPITAEVVAQDLGFSERDVARFLAGEIVTFEIEETTDKQLAIAIAMLMQAEFDDIAQAVVQGTTLDTTEEVLGWADIDPAQIDEATFAGVAFTTDEVGEIEALLSEDRARKFNLSREENARFADHGGRYATSQASDPAVVAEVTVAYRQLLADRLRSYLTNGLEGIAPYDRGGEVSSAADELAAAAEAETLVADLLPDVYRAFVEYPNASLDDVEHLFAWAKLQVGDRPVFVLVHSMMLRRPDLLLVLERVFYAGHSFNASQVVTGALPVEKGLAVFFANRTSIDLVAGFLSGLRHKIGRGLMEGGLVPLLNGFRATCSD